MNCVPLLIYPTYYYYFFNFQNKSYFITSLINPINPIQPEKNSWTPRKGRVLRGEVFGPERRSERGSRLRVSSMTGPRRSGHQAFSFTLSQTVMVGGRNSYCSDFLCRVLLRTTCRNSSPVKERGGNQALTKVSMCSLRFLCHE